jgi:large subunit ribosomal protein L20
MLHALKYAYRHRKELKGDMRRLWIIRIGAGVRAQGLSYSQFMYGLKQANVSVDRKVMAELAINDITAFTELVTVAKAQLAVAA